MNLQIIRYSPYQCKSEQTSFNCLKAIFLVVEGAPQKSTRTTFLRESHAIFTNHKDKSSLAYVHVYTLDYHHNYVSVSEIKILHFVKRVHDN